MYQWQEYQQHGNTTVSCVDRTQNYHSYMLSESARIPYQKYTWLKHIIMYLPIFTNTAVNAHFIDTNRLNGLLSFYSNKDDRFSSADEPCRGQCFRGHLCLYHQGMLLHHALAHVCKPTNSDHQSYNTLILEGAEKNSLWNKSFWSELRWLIIQENFTVDLM
jgi:hypothetical protein